MAEARGENPLVIQTEELKFAVTWAGGECPSSSAKLTNQTVRHVGFAVKARDPHINYKVNPSCGIVPPFGTCRITVTMPSSGLCHPVEQQGGEISVFIFYVTPDCQEKDIDQVLQEKLDYHPSLCHHTSPRDAICEHIIPVCWVDPQIEIPKLMNKVGDEVSGEHLGPALETLGQAIELHPNGYLLLIRALLNHMLGQKEEVSKALQEAQRLLPISELAKGIKEVTTSSQVWCIISDILGVPTYTMEKLCGKQIIVNPRVEDTENQQFSVEVRLTPSVVLREDNNVELSVLVDSAWFKVVKSEKTDSSPNHFLQSLRIKVRPTGKWSESFKKGFGLFRWSPGNERNPLLVQQGRGRGFVVGVNVGASSSAVLQVNGNITSGATFPAFGFKNPTREDHAFVFEYELRHFEDGSSAQNLHGRQLYRDLKIPEAVQGEVNYPNLGKDEGYEGTWLVPYATAMELRNELEFTISLEAQLPALRKCKMSSLLHHRKSPKQHDREVWKWETRQICLFAIAGLKSFIGKNT